jgi:uncharacterized protein (TIGR00725 family)
MTCYVAVVGPADATPEQAQAAYEVGALLARAGVVVLCGGHGGVMAEVARGAAEAGGVSIGILPGADRSDAAEHLSYALPTGLGQLRNGVLVTAADGVLAIGGSWGTLNEVALARRLGKPLVALDFWAIDGPAADLVRSTDSADAVRTLLAMTDLGEA